MTTFEMLFLLRFTYSFEETVHVSMSRRERRERERRRENPKETPHCTEET